MSGDVANKYNELYIFLGYVDTRTGNVADNIFNNDIEHTPLLERYTLAVILTTRHNRYPYTKH